MTKRLSILRVHALPGRPTRGRLVAGAISFDCVLGRSGIIVDKREGDGGTPRGRLPIRRLFLRLDRIPRLQSALPTRAITSQDAWCDDKSDRRYNTLIRREAGEAEERLRRKDRLYDVIVELGWNDAPVKRGRGSAIFWHICRENRTPTAGCVAVTPDVFRKVLPRLARHAVMVVG